MIKYVVSLVDYSDYENVTKEPMFIFDEEIAANEYAERANKIYKRICLAFDLEYLKFKAENWPNTPFDEKLLILFKRREKCNNCEFEVEPAKERAPIKRYSFNTVTKTEWQYIEPVTKVFDTVEDTLKELFKHFKQC